LALAVYGAFSQGIPLSPQDAMLADQKLEQSREIANVTEGNSSASPQKDVQEGTITPEPALPQMPLHQMKELLIIDLI